MKRRISRLGEAAITRKMTRSGLPPVEESRNERDEFGVTDSDMVVLPRMMTATQDRGKLQEKGP